MVDTVEAFDSTNGYGDDVSPRDAASYIHDLSTELAGLARAMRLSDVAAALDRVTRLAAEAQSRANAASDDAA